MYTDSKKQEQRVSIQRKMTLNINFTKKNQSNEYTPFPLGI